MKKLFIIAFVSLLYVVACQGQPRNEYELYTHSVPTAVKYHYFLEQETNPYLLQEGMDYMDPNVFHLWVGESPDTAFSIVLDNNGIVYKIGVVAENIAGFYGGMGTAIDTAGIVPATAQMVGMRKKQ